MNWNLWVINILLEFGFEGRESSSNKKQKWKPLKLHTRQEMGNHVERFNSLLTGLKDRSRCRFPYSFHLYCFVCLQTDWITSAGRRLVNSGFGVFFQKFAGAALVSDMTALLSGLSIIHIHGCSVQELLGAEKTAGLFSPSPVSLFFLSFFLQCFVFLVLFFLNAADKNPHMLRGISWK